MAAGQLEWCPDVRCSGAEHHSFGRWLHFNSAKSKLAGYAVGRRIPHHAWSACPACTVGLHSVRVASYSCRTSITGPIASVAFLSGPIASRIVGKGRSNLLASALVGVVLILASELVGQNLFAVRYPVGVITGILGAPYLLLLLLQINKKGERV